MTRYLTIDGGTTSTRISLVEDRKKTDTVKLSIGAGKSKENKNLYICEIKNGIEEIQYYDSIENEYIKKEYRGARILRCVSIFGGARTGHLHSDVLLYLNLRGEIYITPTAPECIKRIFRQEGVRI